MGLKGENVVKLTGFLKSPTVKYTDKGTPRFQAKIAVPVEYERNGEPFSMNKMINICAWGKVAEAMMELVEDTPITVMGSLNVRLYNSSCNSCSAPTKKNWTEVQVNTYVFPDIFEENE